jgi:hypothetical protein
MFDVLQGRLEGSENMSPRKEPVMLTLAFIALLTSIVLGPFLGVDTTDARSENARPREGWFPGLPTR